MARLLLLMRAESVPCKLFMNQGQVLELEGLGALKALGIWSLSTFHLCWQTPVPNPLAEPLAHPWQNSSRLL